MFFLRFQRCSRDPLRGSAWSRCKNPWFFAISNMPARPSAGIGVVEVQKAMFFFCDFQHARATLCGDRRGRGAKTHGFLRFPTCPRDPLQGSAWSRCKNPCFFVRFLRCPRNPLRGSAWSRCKNSRFFAISAVLAQPLQESAWSRCKNELVLESCLVVRAPAPGTGGSRVRFLPGPRAGVARCNLHFKATCAEQLAQSKLHRATCADQLAPTSLRRAPCLEQLAQSNLRRATCAEQLAQSSLHRATCRERNLHRATCREPLAGTNLPEQLARSNLRSGAVSRLLHKCFVQGCSVGPTSLAMFCFRANRGLVFR